MYYVIWSSKAQKDLEDLGTDIATRVINRIEQIKYTPHHFIERLAEVEGWKARVGDYRIILDVDDKTKTLVILKIGHRKNIYKKLD